MAQRGCSAEVEVEVEGQSKNWWKIGSDSVDASIDAPPPNSIFDTTVTPSIRLCLSLSKKSHSPPPPHPRPRPRPSPPGASQRHSRIRRRHPHRYRTIEQPRPGCAARARESSRDGSGRFSTSSHLSQISKPRHSHHQSSAQLPLHAIQPNYPRLKSHLRLPFISRRRTPAPIHTRPRFESWASQNPASAIVPRLWPVHIRCDALLKHHTPITKLTAKLPATPRDRGSATACIISTTSHDFTSRILRANRGRSFPTAPTLESVQP